MRRIRQWTVAAVAVLALITVPAASTAAPEAASGANTSEDSDLSGNP
jgi:hypothetical protein